MRAATALGAGLALLLGTSSALRAQPVYEIHAVRYATLPAFRVSGLIGGADTARRLDIAMMVWVIRGADGRTVLFDAGFQRADLLARWKPTEYLRPDSAVAELGVRADRVSDVIVSHVHWDHFDGASLFPRARVWLQREEVAHHLGDDGRSRDRALDSADAAMLHGLRTAGRLGLVDGDAQEILPGITAYTGGKHTFASQYLVVRTAQGPVVLASDNAYLYENLDRSLPIAQTLDRAANLAAQARMKSLAGSSALIVPGHDPAVFARFPLVSPRVARIAGSAPAPAPAPARASAPATRATARRAQNVVLVMSDGLRWQELFGGADSALLAANADSLALRRDFWRATAAARRATLFPFFWRAIASGGVVFGDSASGNIARIANPLKFSYPGYSETFTGFVDPRIDSNEYPPNPNVTVLEWLNRTGVTRGRVAAHATWDAFSRIINAERSGIPVRDGWERGAPGTTSAEGTLLAALYATTVRYWGNNAFDALMQQSTLETVRAAKPRVLFVGYGETDEWAHGGRYDLYLRAARQFDRSLEELWTTLQRDPQYRDKTTLIVTADHGRGNGPRWRDHGADVVGAERIWIGVMGPDTPATGVVRTGIVTQSQIAATVAAALGFDWNRQEPRAAPPLPVFR